MSKSDRRSSKATSGRPRPSRGWREHSRNILRESQSAITDLRAQPRTPRLRIRRVALLSTRGDRSGIRPPSRGGRIAQLVEQLTLNQRVAGSSPAAPTIFPNRNSALDGRGHECEGDSLAVSAMCPRFFGDPSPATPGRPNVVRGYPLSMASFVGQGCRWSVLKSPVDRLGSRRNSHAPRGTRAAKGRAAAPLQGRRSWRSRRRCTGRAG